MNIYNLFYWLNYKLYIYIYICKIFLYWKLLLYKNNIQNKKKKNKKEKIK